MAESNAFKLQDYHKTAWTQLHSSTTRPKGGMRVEILAGCYVTIQVFPAWRHPLRQRGRSQLPKATTSGGAQTSPPEGCFDVYYNCIYRLAVKSVFLCACLASKCLADDYLASSQLALPKIRC
jgi:hypothetical protein